MNTVKLDGFKLVGLKLDKKTTNEGGQSSVDCGNLWQQFEGEKIFEKIPNKVSLDVYAVYYDYEGDHTQPFSYFIGCRVEMNAEAPTGLQSLIVPEQYYTTLIAKGKMPDCVSNSWREIWKSKIDRSYGYDFEVYDERSKNWNEAEVKIMLSVKSLA